MSKKKSKSPWHSWNRTYVNHDKTWSKDKKESQDTDKKKQSKDGE